ncbi:MAG: transposase [Proteobacteria bacterium]|nr:transposase [Pseudomonadota bacterium]
MSLLPTNRLPNQYAELGLPISPGTVAGALKKQKELFQPVYDAIYRHQMTDSFDNRNLNRLVFGTTLRASDYLQSDYKASRHT